MTDAADRSNRSTNPTEEQREYTRNLGDGSNTGDATEDPDQDSDTTSGGEAERPDETAS